MSRISPHESPTQMELDILRSFGWAVVELESVLFERYTQMSSIHSVISLNAFRKALFNMEAKGLLASVYLHGDRAYRKQVLDERLLERILPKNPNEEMRLALAGRRARKSTMPPPSTVLHEKHASEDTDPLVARDLSGKKFMFAELRTTEELIGQTQVTSELLVERMEHILQRGTMSVGKTRRVLAVHIDNMRRLLGQSEDQFFEYVRKEFPELEGAVQKIISDCGADYLLLSIRLADSRLRKYL